MSLSVANSIEIPSFFDGVPPDAAAEIIERLETRRFPPGAVVVAEGDSPRQMYLALSGVADVVVDDRRVGSVHPGTTVGEMSLFTGQAASATVRAVDEFVAYVVSERELEQIATAHPQVYRNLAAMLSSRLARTNRLAARQARGKLVLVSAERPLHAYALACSLAWHCREPTALLVAGEAPDLEWHATAAETPGTTVVVDRSGSDGGIARHVEQLSGSHAHVLVFDARRGAPPSALADAALAEVPKGFALAEADEEALRTGFLACTTDAGRALGRIARDVGGLTVGLALGAGSLRGYAHIGVLRGLARHGLEPDLVCGTSIGSAVAAGYAMEYDVEKIERMMDGSASTIFKPRLPFKGFLTSKPLGRYLREACEGNMIEDLRVPLGIVAADLHTHREVVFRRGVVWRAVLASMAIPGIFPAQRMGPLTLVDGGVVNAVPTGVAYDMGASTVIAVRLLRLPDNPEVEGDSIEETATPPAALSVILRSFDIMMARTGRESGAATVTITPELPNLSAGKLRNFADGGRFVEAGEVALEEAMPRIRSVLPWMRT